MDGQTDLKLRQHMADEYNKDDSIFLFLLSIKATGQGLTLTVRTSFCSSLECISRVFALH